MKKSSGGMNMHSGLSRKSPKDSNMGVPAAKTSCTVDNEAVRGGTAPTPKSLGGRTA
jgi:hypothetical protein